jgi:F0F1-type ATP synthase membrane subunit b/b'
MKTKPFLMLVFGTAFAGWLVLLLLLGPTGYRREFTETPFTFHGHEYPRKQAHDHYLATGKSPGYKLYTQRPELHPPLPGRDPDMEAMGMPQLTVGELEFMEAYEAQPLFQAERKRLFWFDFLVNVFNLCLLATLVWRFARAPMAKFLSEKTGAIRALLDAAASERAQAEERLAHARATMDALPQERERVQRETEERVQRELEALREASEQSIAIFEQETEDRKRKEALNAAMLVKKELVNESIDRVIAKLRENTSPDAQAAWLGDFARSLERPAS